MCKYQSHYTYPQECTIIITYNSCIMDFMHSSNSWVLVHNEREWLKLIANYLSYSSFILLFYFYFFEALQHKCWRPVGHQVLQPAEESYITFPPCHIMLSTSLWMLQSYTTLGWMEASIDGYSCCGIYRLLMITIYLIP